MVKDSIFTSKQEEFIDYVVEKIKSENTSLPSIGQISKELGVSIPCLREQMELSRILGIIELQPRRGISIQPYQFGSAVVKSLKYSIKLNKNYFSEYSQLRMHLESAFFLEAVKLLDEADLQHVYQLTQSAKKKLNSNPIQIPHIEHRTFHLYIFSKLNNVFVKGLLESYWDIYETIGMDVYFDLDYLNAVWDYHESIAIAIIQKNYSEAHQKLIDHMQYIYQMYKE